MHYQNVLFDLDGTLTDPREGITRSIQFALSKMGIEEPDLTQLEHFIGPPLLQALMEFYAFTEAQAWDAVG